MEIQRTSSCLESHFTTLNARQRSRKRPTMRLSEFLSNFQFTTSISNLERILIPNPLHIFEKYLLPAAVKELGRSAVSVPGNSLSGFKSAVIFQKVRDAGRPESVR
jgi:hypothetical protein